MQSFIVTLLIASVTMSALGLLYMAAAPFLAKRYSEKGRYYVWMIIVIGLIIPFRPQFNNAVLTIDLPSEPVISTVQAESRHIGNEIQIAIPFSLENEVPVPAMPAPENANFISSLHGIEWQQIAAAVWLAGLLVFLTYHAIKHYCFIKMVKRWSENIADRQAVDLLQSLKSEMYLSEQIGFYKCSSIGTPMMIGFIKPRILLPKTDFTQEELRFILKHELVHYRRKDLYYKCLVLFATAIHWFNPIVYMISKAIYAQCESSCDAEIVQSEDVKIRQRYIETIIGVARHQSKLKTALSTNFYGGKKGMKKRIFSIMDTGRKKTGIAVFCAVLIIAFGAGFVLAANTNTSVADAATFELPNIEFSEANNVMPSITEIMSNNIEIDSYYGTAEASPSAIEIWIASALAEAYAFVEATLEEAYIWAAAQVAENRVWAAEQVAEERAWAEAQPGGRVWNGRRYESAEEWIAERYHWKEDWIAGRYQWAEDWIAGRYEWAEDWLAGRYEWAEEMRALAETGALGMIIFMWNSSFESIFTGVEAFGITFGGSLAEWDDWEYGEPGNIYYQGRLVRSLIDDNFLIEGVGTRFMITSGRLLPGDISSFIDIYVLRDENGNMTGVNVVEI